MTVFTPSYLFQTVLDLDVREPINIVMYLIGGGLTCFFLTEAYKQMYETESTKSSMDSLGKYMKELETRRNQKAEKLRGSSVTIPENVTTVKTAQDFLAESMPGKTWKELSKDEKAELQLKETANEVGLLVLEINELRHLQYQASMGWSLFFCNLAFITLSVMVAFLFLKAYDVRVNYIISTVIPGLVVQLVAKQNDESAMKNRGTGKKVKAH
eukprot:Sspe_Gene.2093::Locus_694_Transcript_1_1_Confidence_1.000_Length_931::g.2093::m.2093